MAILRLIGSKRFMHKRACPNVIELNGLTNDISDKKLIKSLLALRRIDADNKEYHMFERYVPEDKVLAKPTQDTQDIKEADPEPAVEEPVVESVAEEPVVEEPEVAKPKPPVKKKAASKKTGRSRSRAKAT